MMRAQINDGAGLRRRIYQLDTEYSAQLISPTGKILPMQDTLVPLFQAATQGEQTDLFLDNGGRLSLTSRCRSMYSTPECDTPLEVVCYDKAGECYLQQLASTGETFLARYGSPAMLKLFKTNNALSVSPLPQWAPTCCETYSMDRRVSFRQIAIHLIPFLVTRQIFTGTGWVHQTDSGVQFHLSQRGSHIAEEISIAATPQRGLLSTREAAYAPREEHRGLRVIAGEPNRSEYASYLKLGTTAILLQMLEDGFGNHAISLQDPVKASHQISADPTCRQVVELTDGSAATAIQIQHEYLSLARRYFELREPDSTVTDILQKWEYVLTALSEDPMQLGQQVDWVTKKRIMENHLDRHHLSWDSPEVLKLSQQYHSLNPNRQFLCDAPQQGGDSEQLLTEQQIHEAVSKPPSTTRARIRGQLIQQAKLGRVQLAVDWVRVQVYHPCQKVVDIANPFQSEHPGVDELIGRLDADKG